MTVAVWNSGILLFRLLDELSVSNPSNLSILRGKTVLELGCGTALVSIACAKLGAASVIATDANPEVLLLAEQNIERNNVSNVAKIAELHWGGLDASEFESAADIIIGSDLTYNSGSWLSLAETMSAVLRPGGVVVYLTLGHSSFNVGGEIDGFISVAENAGLQILTQGSDQWRKIIVNNSIDNIIFNMTTSSEKSVIDSDGGARVILLAKKKK